MRKHNLILGTEANLGFSVQLVPNVPKILVMGQSNGCIFKIKKEL
jgi:hypothetical protein